METGITLLTAGHVPRRFWYHSIPHSVFLINRMPSRVFDMMSPFQKLFNKQPKIASLKIFGCSIYPYLRPYNTHKLQPRSTQCVFLGYSLGYKGAMCYNIMTRKLLVSRHVIHDESCFPFALIQSNVRSLTQELVQSSSTMSRPVIIQFNNFFS